MRAYAILVWTVCSLLGLATYAGIVYAKKVDVPFWQHAVVFSLSYAMGAFFGFVISKGRSYWWWAVALALGMCSVVVSELINPKLPELIPAMVTLLPWTMIQAFGPTQEQHASPVQSEPE